MSCSITPFKWSLDTTFPVRVAIAPATGAPKLRYKQHASSKDAVPQRQRAEILMVSSVGWLAGDASTCCVCFDVVYRMRACLSIKAKIMSACCSLQSLSVFNHNGFRGVLFDEACRTAAAAMHAFPAHSTVLERCMDIYIYNRDCLSSRGCKSQYDPLLVSRRRHCRRRRIKA